MKVIRANLTFEFDETKVTEDDIKDRLDAILTDEFGADVDIHTRWVTRLADSPLFAAAKDRGGRARRRTPKSRSS
jgi:hypothetical protein